VIVGFTVIEAVVAALLHRNDTPPDAVSVDEPLMQIEALEFVMLHAGGAFTTTVAAHDDVQPLLASVTVTV